MYIIEVTPFSKSIRNDSYSYFSTKPIEIGSIVTISLRKKIIEGLVVDVKEGKELKSQIKSSDFQIKKILKTSPNLFFKKELIQAIKETADFFATSIGSIITNITPKILTEEIDKFKPNAKTELQNNNQTKSQKYIIQTEDDDRYSEYKSIIRENFAKNKSVIFVVPTIEDCHLAEKKLSRGIEKDTFVLNSRTTQKNILEKWMKIKRNNKPILLVTTCSFITLPIEKIGIIIIERENSSAYRTMKMPYIDMRFFIEKYAEKLNIPILFGDMMLRTETLKRYDEHDFFEYTPIKFRSITNANQKMIDLKDENEIINKENPLSKSLINLITENISQNEHLFILNNRKGLAPLVVCGDCGQIVKCNECDSPITLYGKDATVKENYFYCHFCGAKRPAGEKCSNCNSWRLETVGFGTDKIKKEIEKQFPKTKILILDKDHSKTPSQAQKVINDFYESPSAILVGTELALLYLHQPIENVAISSIDSMFSSPDFRIREKILNILLKVRSKAQKNFLIQSRNLDNEIFDNLKAGNLTEFYRTEFIERKKYNFPPFSLIIKISTSARKYETAENEINLIKEELDFKDMIIFESLVKNNKGLKTATGFLRIDRKEWPNQEIIEKLKNLPAKIKLEIDAENLF